MLKYSIELICFVNSLGANFTYRAERFVCVEQRLHFAFLVLEFAVLDSILPVTCLLLYIEVQTRWTSDSLQALGRITLRSRNSRV
jgi:hypothetical protein